jgi:1-acyl-sn-glycerol-3-phosphate acyltransferase
LEAVNYFIDRDSDDPEDVRTDVQDLLSDLRENEGALIYPEGTRFEARGNQEMADRARGLRHTLTPRLGGALAMLEANSGLDVVFFAHTGFGVVRADRLDQRRSTRCSNRRTL